MEAEPIKEDNSDLPQNGPLSQADRKLRKVTLFLSIATGALVAYLRPLPFCDSTPFAPISLFAAGFLSVWLFYWMVSWTTKAMRTETRITVLVLAVVMFVLACISPAILWILSRPREHVQSTCGGCLLSLRKTMAIYAGEHGGYYPKADQWCDLLVMGDYAALSQFLCDRSDAVEGESSYALNKNVTGRKVSELPADLVLLFETDFPKDPAGRQEPITERAWYDFFCSEHPAWAKKNASKKVHKLRWNQYGGPEMVTTEKHNGEGCNITFVDGSVKFVKSEELDKLRWTVDEPKGHGGSRWLQ